MKHHTPPRTRLGVEALEDRTVPAGGVLYWHDVALDAVRLDHGIGAAAEQFGPTRASRALAIVQAAVFDAANSVAPAYAPYKFQVPAAAGASVDAAVAQAAHDTLAALYPSQRATFDVDLILDMATIAAGPAQAGAAVGASVAAQMLAWRAADGAKAPSNYTVTSDAGHWSVDPLHLGQKALTPGWGSVTPFTMTSGDEFRPPAPPAMTSPEYTAAYNELLAFGGDGVTTPTQRTADQTEIGIFWGYDGQPGLCSPPRLYNQIAALIARQQGTTGVDAARLFALVNLAQADAGISSWEAKFHYDLWRPVTAIRGGADDGNPDTAGDPTWTPLGAPADNGGGTNFTPPFPAYTSGHATFGGAVFQTLRDFYGTDALPFTFVSDEFNGKTFDMNGQVRPIRPRHFDTLSQAEEENGQSRIYLGIHWAFDKTEGIKEGNRIADQAFANFLRPVAEYHWFVVGADEGGAARVKVIDADTGAAVFDFVAFAPDFRGGVRVALGDVTGDGVPDIIAAAGRGGSPHVKVFDGTDGHLARSFLAYDAAFAGGVYVAAGDVDGDGFADVVTGAGETGGPVVRAFSGKDGAMIRNFVAFAADFRCGVRVAAGDVTGDGAADIVTGAGAGGAAHVKAFDGATGAEVMSFFATDPAFRGGVYVAAGDCDGDGKADVLTGAGAGGGARVQVFGAGAVELQSYTAFTPAPTPTTNGVRVASADLNGDGKADVLTAAGPGDAPVVECREATGLAQLQRLFAFEPDFLGGVNV